MKTVVGYCFIPLLAGCANPHRSGQSRHEISTYSGRPDGLVRFEKWVEKDSGGGIFVMTDPSSQSIRVIHRNQTALGGGSTFSMGSYSSVVDTNSAAIIGSLGTAAGNVAGAIGKAAAGLP